LAPALKEALSKSGLFYESHMVQWLSGNLETESLLQEPQGQHLASATLPSPQTEGAQRAGRLSGAPPQNATPLTGGTHLSDQVESVHSGYHENSGAIPARLLPVVQQQLEVMGTNTLSWEGVAWPGQTVRWEVEQRSDEPKRDSGGGRDAPEAATSWRTRLQLTTPNLGKIDAELLLNSSGVAIRVRADEAQTRQILQQGREVLDDALAAAGLNLQAVSVETLAPERKIRSQSYGTNT
jgi:hypothetical protein